jgi:hypothetical protein
VHIAVHSALHFGIPALHAFGFGSAWTTAPSLLEEAAQQFGGCQKLARTLFNSNNPA